MIRHTKKMARFILEGLKSGLMTSNIDVKRPIFLWGSARSGTFLVQDILSLNRSVRTLTRNDRQQKGIWGGMHHGDDTPDGLKMRPMPNEGFFQFWRSVGVPADWRGAACVEDMDFSPDMVIQLYQKLDRSWFWEPKHGKNRILDKAVIYILMIDLIESIFPDAIHIFCVRDPRAIANSILRLWRFSRSEALKKAYPDGFYANMYPQGYEKFLESPLVEKTSWQVASLMRVGLQAQHDIKNRVRIFRYEELIHDRQAGLKRLFELAELDLYPDLEALLPESFSNYSPRWPSSTETFEATEEICFASDELDQLHMVEIAAKAMGYQEQKVGSFAQPTVPEDALTTIAVCLSRGNQ